MSTLQGRNGFSLLEMSVVLTVIAMIGGVGMTIASNALKAADRISTQERLNMIKIALDSHAKTYGYLPCPASLAIASNDAAFGVEQRVAATPTTCSATVGAVPVRSLNLPDSYAGDAWGNKFTYTTTATMVAGPTSWTTNAPGLTINYGPAGSEYVTTSIRQSTNYTNGISGGSANLTFGTSLTARTIVTLIPTTPGGYSGSYFVKADGTTSIITSDALLSTNVVHNGTDTGGTASYQTTGTGAAYVVVSHGPNGLGSYPTNGTVQLGCGSSTTDDENCDGDTSFYDTDYNDNTDTAANYFDDYLVWGSNESARGAVSNTVYTPIGSAPKLCPPGVCEPWCAACDKNYPGNATGGSSNVPPTGAGDILNGGTVHGLCRKVIVSNSTDCKAACFWSGQTSTNTYYPCP